MKCGAYILDRDKSHIVIVHEHSYPIHKRKWGIPKGTLELYETYLECILREVREETNLDLKKLDLKTLNKHEDDYFVIWVIQINKKHEEVPITPDNQEIDTAIWVPISTFLNAIQNPRIKPHYNYPTRKHINLLMETL